MRGLWSGKRSGWTAESFCYPPLYGERKRYTGCSDCIVGRHVDAFLEGHRVYLRGLGYFDITLTNDEIRSLKEGNVRKVHFKSVKFVPEASLRKRLERGMKFVRASSTIPFSNRLTEEEVNEKLAGYFASHPFITRMEMQKLCGFKRSMALACINRLIDEGRLRNMGTRRTPVYVPVEGAFPLPDSEAGE